MNLISDLGTDLAVAFFVEKRHRQKIESKDVPAFIEKIEAVLESEAVDQAKPAAASHQTSRYSAN